MRKFAIYILPAVVGIGLSLAVVMTIKNPSGEMSRGSTSKEVSITESFTVNDAAKLGIKVKPDGSAVYAAFYRSNDGATNAYLIQSINGIETFSNPVRVNQKEGDASEVWYPVSIAVSPTGAIYVAWAIKHEDVAFSWHGVRSFRIAKSTDGGRSFGAPISPWPAPLKEGLSVERTFFDLASSSVGTLFVSFLALGINSENGVAQYTDHATLRVFRSLDHGNRFSVSVLDDPVCVCCHTKAVPGPSGEVYFSWRSLNESTEKQTSTDYWFESGEQAATARDIVVARTLDGGIGDEYSKPQRIPAEHWFINGCPSSGAGIDIDDQGRIHAAYFTGSEQAIEGIGYYYAYSDDNGSSFTRILLLTDSYIPLVHQGTSLVVDEVGNAWVTFITPRISNDEGEKKTN